tara:strand:- start:2237 stop:2881 length:645 start_codon:yes stop_codon:yes gene_type:complete
MHNIRLMVLNYKRKKNVYNIAKAYSKVMPVSVINNNPYDPFPYVGHPIDVINNEKNYYCMERWVRCYDYPEEYKLIVDDDILPHASLVKRLYEKNLPIVGIYGKTNVEKANSYSDLIDHWCVDAKVDFLVGSVILVRQSILDKIKSQIEKTNYPIRGDDIIISYLIKKELKLDKLETISGKVENLDEGNLGLNKHPDHFKIRWKVVEKFKNIGW